MQEWIMSLELELAEMRFSKFDSNEKEVPEEEYEYQSDVILLKSE